MEPRAARIRLHVVRAEDGTSFLTDDLRPGDRLDLLRERIERQNWGTSTDQILLLEDGKRLDGVTLDAVLSVAQPSASYAVCCTYHANLTNLFSYSRRQAMPDSST